MSRKWVCQNNVAYALIPKVGTSSIRNTLYNHASVYYMHVDDIDVVETRVLFLREPIARIGSAYRFFKNQHELGCKHMGNACPTDTYEEFIDHILRTPNEHWDSQVAQVTDSVGTFMPTDVYRFEDISKVWDMYSPSELNHKNSAPTKYEWDTQYRLDDLENHCHDDIKLYETLTPYEDK